MSQERPFTNTLSRLRAAGLRPTRQRLALGRLLLEGGERHVTAEGLHEEAARGDIKVSLATVYNTLHQFTDVGLLREVVVEPGKSYFDTNTDDHHHFFYQESGELEDIPSDAVSLRDVPDAPPGNHISRVDVVIRLRRN